ncbi:hypothetical protein ACIQNG_34210 [Streptomyces sp. NPDC091377]|uniref:hypothetical protein n=1 Tax=Streptomyces sp. NPDC091377 TaxID=3365995 RepID=UPI00381A2788
MTTRTARTRPPTDIAPPPPAGPGRQPDKDLLAAVRRQWLHRSAVTSAEITRQWQRLRLTVSDITIHQVSGQEARLLRANWRAYRCRIRPGCARGTSPSSPPP